MQGQANIFISGPNFQLPNAGGCKSIYSIFAIFSSVLTPADWSEIVSFFDALCTTS